MTEAGSSAAAVKRRQYLLLAGVAALIVLGTMLSMSLTGSRTAGERPASPKSTHILAPGAQVDPRDAWRGQADAQLRAIEQKSRELTQRDSELEDRSREMMERLRKLEGDRNTGSPRCRRPRSLPPRRARASAPTRLPRPVPTAGCSACPRHRRRLPHRAPWGLCLRLSCQAARAVRWPGS